jgi:hypothetical protein
LEDGRIKWFTDEYQPFDKPEYSFVETKEVEVQNGEEYEIVIIGSVQGQDVQKFTPKNFPNGDDTFVWHDTRVKKNRVQAAKIEPKVTAIKGLTNLEVTATVTDETGEMVGTYLPNYNTGRLVFAFEPGHRYEITIEAPGFQTITEKVNVMGLGDFVPLIKKTYTLVENGLEVPGK